MLPKRYQYFLGNDCSYYDKLERKLRELNINVINTQSIVSKIREEGMYQPFSKTGTHWNLYGAGRVLQE